MKKRTKVALFAVLAAGLMCMFTGCAQMIAMMIEANMMVGTWERTSSTTKFIYEFSVEGDDGWTYTYETRDVNTDTLKTGSTGTWTFEIIDTESTDFQLVLNQKESCGSNGNYTPDVDEIKPTHEVTSNSLTINGVKYDKVK